MTGVALFAALACSNLFAETATFKNGTPVAEGEPNYNGSISTWITSQNPTSTRNNELLFGKTEANTVRGLLGFDISYIPSNAIINSVTLTLYASSQTNNLNVPVQIDLMAMTSNFTTSTANWNNSAGNYDSDALASTIENPYTVSPSVPWVFSSSESMVQFVQEALASNDGMVNFMLKLAPSDEGLTDGRHVFRLYSSSAGDVIYRPYLTIDYAIPEPGTVALALSGAALVTVALVRRRRKQAA